MKDLMLRLSLYAYPRARRRRDGRAIIDLARDLASEGRLAFLRETTGLLWGGVRERAGLVRLDFVAAPWSQARERLALPLAAGILCLFTAFAAVSPPQWLGGFRWLQAWIIVGLATSAVAVVASLVGRRRWAVAASFGVMAVMFLPTIYGLAGHQAVWSGHIVRYAVDVFVMWLPVALVLPICAPAVGRARRSAGPRAWVIVCVAVTGSAVSGVLGRHLHVTGFPDWQSELGGAFVYVPLALITLAIVAALARRDPVARTAAALLVVGGCFPVVWLGPAFLPVWLPRSWYSTSFWFLCYTPQVAALCLVAWALLRRRYTFR